MAESHPPLHMDEGSRIERLYKYLLSLGLYVSPILIDDSSNEIDYLCVSVGLPGQKGAEPSSSTGVGVPVFGSEVQNTVRTPKGIRGNVAEFPTVVR